MGNTREQYKVITIEDFAAYKDHIERKAKIEVLKEIKPFGNGKRIQAMIDKLKKGKCCKKDHKKNNMAPREFEVRVESQQPEQGEFAGMKQYMVR